MHSQKKESEQAKLRLPKRNVVPGIDFLPTMAGQAKANAGRDVEVTWSDRGGARQFSLEVKHGAAGLPIWKLWEDDGRETHHVWQYETADCTLIHDMLCMLETAGPQVNPAVFNAAFQANAKSLKASLTRMRAQPESSRPQEADKGEKKGLAQTSFGQRASAESAGRNSASNWQVVNEESITGSHEVQRNSASNWSAFGDGLAAQAGDQFSSTQSAPRSGEIGAPLSGYPANENLLRPEAQSYAEPQRVSGQFRSEFTQESPREHLQKLGDAAGQSGYGAQKAGYPDPQPFGTGLPPGSAAAPSIVASQLAASVQAEMPPDPFAGSPADVAYQNIARAFRALTGRELESARLTSPTSLEGGLANVAVSHLLQSLSMSQLTGKLEIVGDESVGKVYFQGGLTVHAATNTSTGDTAICDLVSWRDGIYRYFLDETIPIRSIENRLDVNIMDGIALLDQKKRLEELGLSPESFLVKMHKRLSEGEVKVFLTKGYPVDFRVQFEVYQKIGHRCTLADLLRDRPMESSLWTRILYNFLTCGLLEIKPPETVVHEALDFLGEAKAAVEAISNQMVRPETGIYTYPALLYFLQYEYNRFESYNWPLTLVIFELNKRSTGLQGGSDNVTAQEATIAAKRIELIKRPLDVVAHFEALQYAMLLPNTTASSGAYVANRVMQALTATPLSPNLDKKALHLAFGIASIPVDGEDIESLILAAKSALNRAREGDFPIVMAGSSH
jgi:GGDEF domain-containing protein